MEKFTKGELVKKILLVAMVGGVLTAVVVLPGLAIIFKMFNAKNAKDRYRIKRTVDSMSQSGLLIRRVKNGVEEFVVTKVGKKIMTEYLIQDLAISRTKHWDNKWRVLMFDIPEKKRRIRGEVSWQIKEIGMKAVQNSVFISPFPCKEQIDIIANHFQVKPYFIYLECDTYEGINDLLSHFKLK